MRTLRDLLILSLAAAVFIFLMTVAFGASPQYCKLFTREFARIAMDHNAALLEGGDATDREKEEATWAMDPKTQPHLLQKNYAWCLNRDEPPPLPDVPEASDEAFIEFIVRRPSVDYAEDATAEALRKIKELWCEENYRTYDPEDGTVVRVGQKGRVPCPFDERVYR